MDYRGEYDLNQHADFARQALAALVDPARGRPTVTYTFLGLCLLVTLPTLFYSQLYGVFGGIEPRQYWWQPFTAVFVHGWPGFHGSIHLLLNTFLILECGIPCERLLGSVRFLILCILAMLANALALSLTPGANGSSLIIWSWGPALFVALIWAKQQDEHINKTAVYERLRRTLVIMYGIIVMVMTVIPYLSGWRGNPLVSMLMGNLYHLVATGVGVGFALIYVDYIQSRMIDLRGPSA